jgi:hypothetical protein
MHTLARLACKRHSATGVSKFEARRTRVYERYRRERERLEERNEMVCYKEHAALPQCLTQARARAPEEKVCRSPSDEEREAIRMRASSLLARGSVRPRRDQAVVLTALRALRDARPDGHRRLSLARRGALHARRRREVEARRTHTGGRGRRRSAGGDRSYSAAHAGGWTRWRRSGWTTTGRSCTPAGGECERERREGSEIERTKIGRRGGGGGRRRSGRRGRRRGRGRGRGRRRG